MRFQALDSWRGIAALCVAIFHFEAVDHVRSLPLINHSFLFVDFFFVLSGFVIAHAYGDKLDSPIAVGKFVTRRFGRVWPLHMAVLTAFLAIVVLKYVATASLGVQVTTPPFDPAGSTPIGTLPEQILLLQAFGVTDGLTWNTPSWSISAEFWTYVLFALTVLILPRHRTAAFSLFAMLSAACVVAFSDHGMDATYDLGLARCIYGFSVGYIVYRARSRVRFSPVSTTAAFSAEALTVAAMVVFVTLANRSTLSFAAPVVFAAVVYVFSFELGPLSRFLKRPFFQKLGLWSYSIYMVHALIAFVIGLAVSELQRRLGVDLWRMVVDDGVSKRVIVSDHVIVLDAIHFAYIATVVAISALSYRLIEEPGRHYFQRLADRMVPVRGSGARVAVKSPICQIAESR